MINSVFNKVQVALSLNNIREKSISKELVIAPMRQQSAVKQDKSGFE